MYGYYASHLTAWLPLIVIVLLVIGTFEAWMIVDAAINKRISDKAKAWRIVGMLIVHPFVAIVYFFTDHVNVRRGDADTIEFNPNWVTHLLEYRK
jgi:hypothetical protein